MNCLGVFEHFARLALKGLRTAQNRMLHDKWVTHLFTATQPVFTCSKLTTETLEQGVKFVQG